MVNRVLEPDHQERDRWQRDDPAEIDRVRQLFGRQRLEATQIVLEHAGVPLRDLGRGRQRVRPSRLAEIEAAGDDGVHEAVFGGDDVPGEIDCALGNGVGPIVALVDRDGVDDPARDRMLRGEMPERDVSGERGLFGLEWRRCCWLHPIIVTASYNPSDMAQWTLSPEDAGVRLDKYLAASGRA
jgi:hypothetical protein